ncbi:probable cytochrome P450 6a17 [Hetaerina americana]|uniref:probable cytochrome P450 6a17 n=1 Tax=Hetaerina americana TaxID=62018 RepID=UPI003A7F2180
MPPLLIWLLIFFTLCFGSLYVYLTWNYDHWKKRSIPHEKPHFPFGNIGRVILGKESIIEFYRNIYDRFKGQRYMGFIMLKEPTLIVQDPGLIKNVLIKDFSHFHDRGFPVDEIKDPMSGNIFNLPGSRWHSLRSKLSPTFTSGKMKYMFPIVHACAEHLQKTLKSSFLSIIGRCHINSKAALFPLHLKTAAETERMGGSIEVKELMARYTTDVIGSAAFGVEVRSLDNPESEFRVIGRRILSATLSNAIRSFLFVFAPSLAIKLGVRSADPVAEDFFTKIVKDTVTYREENNVKRADFLQLLLGLKAGSQEDTAKDHEEAELTMNQLTAQCFIFYVGGFETSATTLSFALFELSRDLAVQRKLLDEVDRVLGESEGEITYEGLAKMHYMDCVIAETLRKYPAVPVLFRECTKEWTIPSAQETGSVASEWKPETRDGGHVVEVGTKVHIPLIGLHYDPEYFEDPDRFDPERFTEEGRKKWPQFAYLPFGEGPRICIGMRFGNMQTKAGLTALLSKFEFRVSSKMADPIVLDKVNMVPIVVGGMWLQPIERSHAIAPKEKGCRD